VTYLTVDEVAAALRRDAERRGKPPYFAIEEVPVALRRDRGLCIRCGQACAEPSRQRCSTCLAADRDRHMRRQLEGLCRCGADRDLPERKLCSRCLAAARARRAAKRQGRHLRAV
jgi:hypothetical protein